LNIYRTHMSPLNVQTVNVAKLEYATPSTTKSLFYGEAGKCEVIYRQWRYEVNCLLRENTYNKECLLVGIRRSLRGEAAVMLVRRFDEPATIDSMLDMFHTTFENTETAASILKNKSMAVNRNVMNLLFRIQVDLRNYFLKRLN